MYRALINDRSNPVVKAKKIIRVSLFCKVPNSVNSPSFSRWRFEAAICCDFSRIL